MEERNDDGELPVEDASRRNVEGVYMHGEQGNKIREDRYGHSGAGKGGVANDLDEYGQMGSQERYTVCRLFGQLHSTRWRYILTSPVVNDPKEQVAQERCQLSVKLQASRPPHEP